MCIRDSCPPLRGGYIERGYAVASINYRLSGHAMFPAQIEDCKAAIRWLRANAAKYHFDPEKIGVVGGSAESEAPQPLSKKAAQIAADNGPHVNPLGLSLRMILFVGNSRCGAAG